jgi:hypothetical protein
MELVALAALGTAAVCLGVSDWKRRTVDLRLVLACYGLAACVNIAILAGSLAGPDADVSKQASTMSRDPASVGESALETVRSAAGSILTVVFLSGVMVAFWRVGLLASGDALAVPAILSMLPFMALPSWIILYFVSAMAFVLLTSVVNNVRNNIRYRKAAYGSLWHRVYLIFFCYYGDGDSCRYAFRYSARTRRDYDSELYYVGSTKTWLVPGLPLLFGFAPATAVLIVIQTL